MPFTVPRFTEVLEELYASIHMWNSDAEFRMGLTINETEHTVHENGDNFVAPGLQLSRSGRTINLIPVSRNLVGADAQADFVGESLRETLAYIEGDGWVHVDRHNYRELHSLDGDRFCRIVEALMR